MSEPQQIKVVDAFDLDDELRSLLRPGEMVRDGKGRRKRLPRYFYEIPSHESATEIRLTPHFGINEFILDDHVHIDLGYITVIPREISEDRMEQPQESRPRFAFEERRRRERRAPQIAVTANNNKSE